MVHVDFEKTRECRANLPHNMKIAFTWQTVIIQPGNTTPMIHNCVRSCQQEAQLALKGLQNVADGKFIPPLFGDTTAPVQHFLGYDNTHAFQQIPKKGFNELDLFVLLSVTAKTDNRVCQL